MRRNTNGLWCQRIPQKVLRTKNSVFNVPKAYFYESTDTYKTIFMRKLPLRFRQIPIGLKKFKKDSICPASQRSFSCENLFSRD